jgi:hypothetical protein
MRKPIVAVTADTLLADMKPINQKMADYAPRPLLNALGRVGLLPIILAYDDYADPEEYVDSFDALVLSGGPNPAPRFYGEEPLWCIGPTYEKRDIFEIGLIKACLKADKPILGICGDRAHVPEHLVALGRWMADYYCCTQEQAIRTLLPAAVRSGKVKPKKRKLYRIADREAASAYVAVNAQKPAAALRVDLLGGRLVDLVAGTPGQ